MLDEAKRGGAEIAEEFRGEMVGLDRRARPLAASGARSQGEEIEPQSREGRKGTQRRSFHRIGKIADD